MFPRKSSVVTVDYNLEPPRGFPVNRRHSAAPFSLTRVPTTDTKYSTTSTSHHSKTSSSQEPRPIKLEDTGYERAFFVRMGRKLSAFLPKGTPAEHQESPVLKIKMRKEVHVATEEDARDVGMGSSGNEGPLLHKLPYLWKSPSEERIHGSHIHDSGVSLRPATAPGGSAERYSRRKPVPPSPMDIECRMTTGIEKSYPKYSGQSRFQTLPPKRTQDMPHYQVSPSPNTVSTVIVPIRPAQMRSLGTAWKSLFGGRARKGKTSYSKKGAVLFARKASLKRNTTHSPYQPYSTRAMAPSPVHTPRDSRRESPVVSRRFLVNHPRRTSRKRKSGLSSFLSIDSSDSLT